jgi:hypothetical protein
MNFQHCATTYENPDKHYMETKKMIILLRIIFLQDFVLASTGDNKNRLYSLFTRKRRQKKNSTSQCGHRIGYQS